MKFGAGLCERGREKELNVSDPQLNALVLGPFVEMSPSHETAHYVRYTQYVYMLALQLTIIIIIN